LSPLSPHPAPSLLYHLALHDALPIYHTAASTERDALSGTARVQNEPRVAGEVGVEFGGGDPSPQVAGPARHPDSAVNEFMPQHRDRKSTRLNSSHVKISYAVFCLKKK